VTPGDRYDVSDLPEAQFEPGSNDQVLRNRLGIISKQEMDAVEARALERQWMCWSETTVRRIA
jgi:cell filamentation protein